jgi:hypothetical protein
MRRIVRARIDATRLFQMGAKIAGRRLLLNYRFLSSELFRIVRNYFKWMQVDISVRAISRT